MRHIQFRAYDSFTGDRINDFSIAELNNDFFIVEQYTGIKDKNGIKIFEGDHIQFQDGSKEEIIFQDGSFGYVSSYSECFFILGGYNNNLIEVVK